MTDQTRNLELAVRVKHLRYKMVTTAITLGLTLTNLADIEGSMGNLDRATWAAENAKKVTEQVRECLRDTQLTLTKEELQSAQEKLDELEKAITGEHRG